MKCDVYGFRYLDDCYLVIPGKISVRDVFENIPDMLGEPILKSTLNITKRSLLLGLSPLEVLADIEKQGFHLKWPEKTYCNFLFVQCMYCNEYLGVVSSSYESEPHENTTHSICGPCLQERYGMQPVSS